MIADMQLRNCPVYWIKFNDSKRKSNYLPAIVSLNKLLRKLKPDIVHTHLFDDGIVGQIAARISKVKCRIHTKQSTAFHWYYARKMIPFDRMINRFATHLIAVSNESKDFIVQQEKAKSGKIHLIHHGINFSELQVATDEEADFLKQKFNLKNKKVALMLSRYIDWKGYKTAIKAAQLLKTEFPDLIFLGVGSGGQEQELKKEITKSGLQERFLLTGWIDKIHIPALFKIADVFVHTAKLEPFGFVFPEAMINEVPMVVTNTGAAKDALNHLESAYITECNDFEATAAGIRHVLTKNTNEWTEKAKEKAIEMYGVDKMFNEHVQLYRSCHAG